MSEMGDDYSPGPWKGFDYGSARKKAPVRDTTAGRGYDTPTTRRRPTPAKVPPNLKTESQYPIVVAVDVTASMQQWPEVIFEKLPLLDLEVEEYFKKPEFSFAAVGDYYSDRNPLQVQTFGKGKTLVDKINALAVEKGGGGSREESYDLAALYYTHNVDMPNAVKPLFIFIGDEAMYQFADNKAAQDWSHVVLDKRTSSGKIIEDLKQKYSVYCIRKLYDQSSKNTMSNADKVIQKQWEDMLGADHVCILNEPRRVVDVILGIFAQETLKHEHFTKELEWRQTPEQVKQVKKALKTIHTDTPTKKSKELK